MGIAAIGFLACGVPVKKAMPSWPQPNQRMLRIQNSLQKLLGGKKARSEAWLFLNGTPVITSSIGGMGTCGNWDISTSRSCEQTNCWIWWINVL